MKRLKRLLTAFVRRLLRLPTEAEVNATVGRNDRRAGEHYAGRNPYVRR